METDGIPANKPRELGMIKEERNGVFVPHTHMVSLIVNKVFCTRTYVYFVDVQWCNVF